MARLDFDPDGTAVGPDVACSVLRRRLGEPMLGDTPETARSWLLVEEGAPWGEEPAVRNPLLPGWLREQAAAAGIRLQLIRRPRTVPVSGRPSTPRRLRPGRRHVFLVHSSRDSSWTLHDGVTEVTPATLPAAVLADHGAGRRAAWGSAWPHPLLLVCTHAKVDACCARFGRPVAAALAAEHPEDVWETSHVGGCRFAANIICLPEGVWFGDSTPDLARRQVAAHLRGEVDAVGLRGHEGAPAAVQVVEPLVRQLCGTAERDAVRLHAITPSEPRPREDEAVTVATGCGPRTFRHRVALVSDGLARPYGCGDPELRQTSSWQVTDAEEIVVDDGTACAARRRAAPARESGPRALHWRRVSHPHGPDR
jgi:(2Fe-2S) ferredoxin